MTLPVKVLLYGEFGTWKTTTALRYNNNARLYATDFGFSVKGNHPEWIDPNQVDIQMYEGRPQLMKEDFQSGHELYVLDTVSEMVELYLDAIMENANWGGKYREKLTSTDVDLKGIEESHPKDYGVIRNQWRPVAKKFNLAPVDVFWLSHETIPTLGLSKPGQPIGPNMPDKTFKAIAQNTTLIGRMTKFNKEIRIDFNQNSGGIVARSRIPALRGKVVTIEEFLHELKDWKKNNE